jgi:nicotinamidase/pyrazinamidase
MKVHVACIDDQNDFTNPNGSLFVKGADENVKRLARMIERLTDKIDDITLTLDSHNKVDISHPMWFVDDQGNPPPPYTQISPEDMESGKWTTRKRGARERTLKYLHALRATNRYPHTIWPEHCLIGDEGANVNPVLSAAVHNWEAKRYGIATKLTKGSNPWTEHFSAVKAEVPDPADPGTQMNDAFVRSAMECDLMLWGGEALSHCFANTFRDTIATFPNSDFVRKMVILTDASSPVDFPIYHKLSEDFLKEMKTRGVQLSTTTDILA